MWLKFLKSLVANAKTRGENTRTSKITGIIQKEASRKWWRRINRLPVKLWQHDCGSESTHGRWGPQQIKGQGRHVQSGHPHTPRMVPAGSGVTMPLRDLFGGCWPSGRWAHGSTNSGWHIWVSPKSGSCHKTFVWGSIGYVHCPVTHQDCNLRHSQRLPTLFVNCKGAYRFVLQGSALWPLYCSFCPDLLLLYTAKLFICARNRVLLVRWGKGLTILLEKIMGNVFVHKLHAICLLEADFNWWNS